MYLGGVSAFSMLLYCLLILCFYMVIYIIVHILLRMNVSLSFEGVVIAWRYSSWSSKRSAGAARGLTATYT